MYAKVQLKYQRNRFALIYLLTLKRSHSGNCNAREGHMEYKF